MSHKKPKATAPTAKKAATTVAPAPAPAVSSITIKPQAQFYILIPGFKTVPQEIIVDGSDTPPPESAYGQWAAQNRVGKPTENPDGDALPNLLEFLFGGQPSQPDYRGIVPFVGWTATNFVLYFQYVGQEIPGAEIWAEVGDGTTWRRATHEDLMKTDGVTPWQPITSEEDLQAVFFGRNVLKVANLNTSPQQLLNIHPGNSAEGLIRLACRYTF